MSVEEDVRVVVAQEEALVFEGFDADRAWALGSRLRELAAGFGKPVSVGIWVAGQTLFQCATTAGMAVGTTPNNEEWMRRKRNTVLLFGRSSLRLGLEEEVEGRSITERQGLPMADYATHGGGVPVILRGTGCVGAVVVSGLPQRDDHQMAVTAMAEMLGVAVPVLGEKVR